VIESIVLAVVLIFLILASQFESLTQPLAIMLSLPLSLIGVLLALLITNDTLNMMSMIGVILLFGPVVKNAILLVDNANERRAAGVERFAAMVEAHALPAVRIEGGAAQRGGARLGCARAAGGAARRAGGRGARADRVVRRRAGAATSRAWRHACRPTRWRTGRRP
jgi:energy-converting hydrogenase Eha subunit E